MSMLPGSLSKSIALVKNSPAARAEFPALVRNLFLGQAAFFVTYSLVSGPS